MTLSRRQFMSRGLLVAAGGLAAWQAPPWARWLGEQMEKIQPRKYVQLAEPKLQTGLVPVEGQPGLFQDMSTGQIVNILDFNESDAYDTIVIPTFAGGKRVGSTRLRFAPKGLR